MTSKQLNILRHAIGYDDSGEDRYPNARSLDERRNRFFTGHGSVDYSDCVELVSMGYMENYGPVAIAGGDDLFTVTDKGRRHVLDNQPPPIKITPGRARYLAFLKEDGGMSFGEWLKIFNKRKRQNQRTSHLPIH